MEANQNATVIELTKEQKIQIVNSRRLSLSRNIFEHQLDIVIMTSQGQTGNAATINQRIQELEATDAALVEFIETL